MRAIDHRIRLDGNARLKLVAGDVFMKALYIRRQCLERIDLSRCTAEPAHQERNKTDVGANIIDNAPRFYKFAGSSLQFGFIGPQPVILFGFQVEHHFHPGELSAGDADLDSFTWDSQVEHSPNETGHRFESIEGSDQAVGQVTGCECGSGSDYLLHCLFIWILAWIASRSTVISVLSWSRAEPGKVPLDHLVKTEGFLGTVTGCLAVEGEVGEDRQRTVNQPAHVRVF